MNEPSWLIYLGAVTGVFGTVTGIIGTILGYFSYRKTSKIKSLDLRIELRKEVKNLNFQLKETLELAEKAKDSRKKVASALGTFKSGAMSKWLENLEKDKQNLKKLIEDCPDSNLDYGKLKEKGLENQLVHSHSLNIETDAIKSKYLASLDEDDENRRFIREQAHNRK